MNLTELIIFILFFISHSVFLGIVLYNLSSAPRLSNIKSSSAFNPFVSVLIPARNEAHNIHILLNSLLIQSYQNFEVIVLNDNSHDNTAEVVKNIVLKDTRLKLLDGQKLPSGWLGKNWACYQLAQYAKGEYLLFIDADVILEINALGNAVQKIKQNNVAALSVFPTQLISSVGEWLVVPLMNWLLLNFLPLRFVYSKKSSSFTAANGQFILIRKDKYELIGTHNAVKNNVVEDMELARRLKSNGEKIITCLGNDAVYCKMYNSFNEAYNGFAKNFFRGFNTSKTVFFLLIVILFTLFTAPIVFYLINDIFLIIILMIILERVFVSVSSKQTGLLSVLLHPLQMLLMLMIGIKSLRGNKLEWKGRSI